VSPSLLSSRARATTHRVYRVDTIDEGLAPGTWLGAHAATAATRRRRFRDGAFDASPNVPGDVRRDKTRTIPPLARGGARTRRECIATTADARILAARRV
tara:strand:- start:794 stop:1093 length:300 start_codon:yes stop_codon:yes gene_type:complete